MLTVKDNDKKILEHDGASTHLDNLCFIDWVIFINSMILLSGECL